METTLKWFRTEEKTPEYGLDGFSRDLLVVNKYGVIFCTLAYEDFGGKCMVCYQETEYIPLADCAWWAYAEYPKN